MYLKALECFFTKLYQRFVSLSFFHKETVVQLVKLNNLHHRSEACGHKYIFNVLVFTKAVFI